MYQNVSRLKMEDYIKLSFHPTLLLPSLEATVVHNLLGILLENFSTLIDKGHLGGLVVECLPLAQGVILASWDQIPHRGPRREPACFSLCLYLCLSRCVFLMNK